MVLRSSKNHVLIDLLLINFYFQGVLVHYRAESKTTDERVELETFVQPIKHYKIIKPVGPINRMKMLQVDDFPECAISVFIHCLTAMEDNFKHIFHVFVMIHVQSRWSHQYDYLIQVGTNFDPKEEIFRNYAGLLGPYSDVTLMHSWGAQGSQFTFTAVFVDPSNNVAGNIHNFNTASGRLRLIHGLEMQSASFIIDMLVSCDLFTRDGGKIYSGHVNRLYFKRCKYL